MKKWIYQNRQNIRNSLSLAWAVSWRVVFVYLALSTAFLVFDRFVGVSIPFPIGKWTVPIIGFLYSYLVTFGVCFWLIKRGFGRRVISIHFDKNSDVDLDNVRRIREERLAYDLGNKAKYLSFIALSFSFIFILICTAAIYISDILNIYAKPKHIERSPENIEELTQADPEVLVDVFITATNNTVRQIEHIDRLTDGIIILGSIAILITLTLSSIILWIYSKRVPSEKS